MSKGRPRRGSTGPNVLVSGDTGPRQPQGGARVREFFRESGDLAAREFGVPQADLPGGINHVVNPETHPTEPPGVYERPADYHKYHGVESDDGFYETPPTGTGRAPRPAPLPKTDDAVPVYIVETGGKDKVRREASHDSILVSGSTDPVRLCNRDDQRVELHLLNEDATNNVRIGTRSELAESRGAMLPAVTNSYLKIPDQGELWAIPAVAGTIAKVSVIAITEVRA